MEQGTMRSPGLSIGVVVPLVAFGIACFSAAGQNAVWINAAGGNWNTAGNWQGAVQPNSSRDTFFDSTAGGTGLTFTVTKSGAMPPMECLTLRVLANHVRVSKAGGAAQPFTLLAPPGSMMPSLLVEGTVDTPHLEILQAGGGFLGGDAKIGMNSGTTGILSYAPSSGEDSQFDGMHIGDAGSGELNVHSGWLVRTRTLSIGTAATGQGTITIAGGTLEYATAATGGLTVGDAGLGIINVDGGGLLTQTVTVPSVTVAQSPGSSGTVSVSGAGSEWISRATQIRIGHAGSGQVTLSSGGAWTSTAGPGGLLIGGTGPGQVNVNSGTIWDHNGGNITLNNGDVVLDGSMTVHNQTLFLNQGGTLSGGGVFSGNEIRNGGLIAPGTGPQPHATLTINAPLTMQGVSGGGGVRIDIRGDDNGDAGKVVVNGTATLGGAITVTCFFGAMPDPSNTMSLPIFSATTYSVSKPYFDVAYLPTLPDGRFYRLNYPGPGGSGDITVGVQSFNGGPQFGDTANTSLQATITAADRGDIDGDSLDDLAVTTSDGFVFVLINNGGNGTFSQAIQLPVGTSPRGVRLVDLDPDNPNANGLDIVVTNSGDDTATVYSRTGAGVWFVAAALALGDDPRGVAFDDFDGDTNIDLVVADRGSSTVSLLNGTSRSAINFQARLPYATDPEPTTIDPWDPDNTKNPRSLLIAAHGGDSISLLRNDGSGGFGPPETFAVGQGPFQVLAADFNRDGFEDAIALNDDGTLSALINDGLSSFFPASSIFVGNDPRALATADLDLDGDPDPVLVADSILVFGVPRAKVLRNDTSTADYNLTFAAPIEVNTSPPHLVLTGRIDGDSKPDIIAISESLRVVSTIATVINTTLCPSDFDQNSFVNGDDFDAFALAFEAGNVEADFDLNGFVNGDDADAFVVAFEAGC